MRDRLRDLVTLAFIVATCPLWGLVLIAGGRAGETSLFTSGGQLLSLLPGRLGVFARRAFYVMTLERCAWDVGVEFGTYFSKRKVSIAPRVSFGARCLIGSCSIGEGTLLGSNIDLVSGRHQHSDGNDAPHRYSQVAIGSSVWIGNRALIMAAVGDGAVIGGGSVVVKPVEAGVTAVGNPARAL